MVAAATGDPTRACATTVDPSPVGDDRWTLPDLSMQKSTSPAAAQPGNAARSAASLSARRSACFFLEGAGRFTDRGKPSRLKRTRGSASGAPETRVTAPVNGSWIGPRVTLQGSPTGFSGPGTGTAEALAATAEGWAEDTWAGGAAVDAGGEVARPMAEPGGATDVCPSRPPSWEE